MNQYEWLPRPGGGTWTAEETHQLDRIYRPNGDEESPELDAASE